MSASASEPRPAAQQGQQLRQQIEPEHGDMVGVNQIDSTGDFLANPEYPEQTWLQSLECAVPEELAIPGLTPDSSSHSPPIINWPAELGGNSQPSRHAHAPSEPVLINNTPDDSTQPPLDPSLPGTASVDCQPTIFPTCACLSTMYLTLNTLQQMTTFTFPFALHPLREAMQTASDVIACKQCPTKFITAIQNVQLLGTLLVSIAERFSKVLHHINDEAARAEIADETKKFRLADLNTASGHLHTGGLGCLAAFSVELTPSEWQSMTKKVVRAEVHGPSDGNLCCPSFLGLIKQMRQRQEGWHCRTMVADAPNGLPVGNCLPKENHLCLKLAACAERITQEFDWS